MKDCDRTRNLHLQENFMANSCYAWRLALWVNDGTGQPGVSTLRLSDTRSTCCDFCLMCGLHEMSWNDPLWFVDFVRHDAQLLPVQRLMREDTAQASCLTHAATVYWHWASLTMPYARKCSLWIANFKILGMTKPGIKPEPDLHTGRTPLQLGHHSGCD